VPPRMLNNLAATDLLTI